MSVVGDIWHPGHLEDAAEETLKTWLPIMIGEVAGNDDVAPPKIKPPASWNLMSEENRWPEDKLPAIIIASPGMVENPERDAGDAEWNGTWGLEITAICRGRNDRETRRLAQIYWAAIVGSILQRRSLGDDRYTATLVDSALDVVPIEKRRTIAGTTALFHVDVRQMLSGYGGPRTETPPNPMPDTWPTVQTTNLILENK